MNVIVSSKSYYSNGKLLLTGEYLVILGAKALAIPVKYGQSMNIREYSNENKLIWTAKEHGKEWFKAVLSCKTLILEESSNEVIGERLFKLLNEIKLMNPGFINQNSGYEIETDINFDRNWGLGTSSTLIANCAAWAAIDPFLLNNKITNGSGFDIACALSSSPIIYNLNNKEPFIKHVTYYPEYHNKMYFIYLEKKQDSKAGIEFLSQQDNSYSAEIEIISMLTGKFTEAKSIEEIIPLIKEHEKLISSVVNMTPVQNSLFPDFPGAIKSLGAWGGDFIMAVTALDKIFVDNYFKSKGFPVVIPFREMILLNE